MAEQLECDWKTVRKWADADEWKAEWSERIAEEARDYAEIARAARSALLGKAPELADQLGRLALEPSNYDWGRTQLGAVKLAFEILGIKAPEQRDEGLGALVKEFLTPRALEANYQQALRLQASELDNQPERP